MCNNTEIKNWYRSGMGYFEKSEFSDCFILHIRISGFDRDCGNKLFYTNFWDFSGLFCIFSPFRNSEVSIIRKCAYLLVKIKHWNFLC